MALLQQCAHNEFRVLLAWRHSRFSVHNGVRVASGDTEGRKKLAQYMPRAPLSLETMTYDARTGGMGPLPLAHA
jgi:hypothetical protein